MLRVLSAPDGIKAPLLVAAVEPPFPAELPFPDDALPELPELLELLPELLELLALFPELPLLPELPVLPPDFPESLEPPEPLFAVIAFDEIDGTGPPHPARKAGVVTATKFRRTTMEAFFLKAFTLFFRGLAVFHPGRLAFALRNDQAFVQTIHLLLAASNEHTKGVATKVTRAAAHGT